MLFASVMQRVLLRIISSVSTPCGIVATVVHQSVVGPCVSGESHGQVGSAFAMLCSQSEFDAFFPELNYQHLRHDIAKVCFENWPRFNIDSLLMYANNNTHGDSGFFAGGGDSGCGGE